MKLEPVDQEVFEALADIPVIDAHQHLYPEKFRTDRKVDFFLFFGDPTRDDLVSAGMERDEWTKLVNDEDMTPEEKWQRVGPFYPMVRHTSYWRPALIYLKDVLGHDDLTAENCREVSEQLQAGNTPGLYQRELADRCHIEAALIANNERLDYRSPLLRPLIWINNWFPYDVMVRDFMDARADHNFDAYLDWVSDHCEQLLSKVVAVKFSVHRCVEPDMGRARETFAGLVQRRQYPAEEVAQSDMASIVCSRAIDFAREHDMPVAVHAGYWGDFRDLDPQLLIPLAQKHPDVQFDLFHLGVPYVREAVMVGKMFPNVSLNLCWCAVTSQEMTVRMLDECLEMIPLSNVIAFGGDYNLPVEKTYGHLVMAKQCVARALGKRIRQDRLDLPEALRIARLWFYENPKRIYRLALPSHEPQTRPA